MYPYMVSVDEFGNVTALNKEVGPGGQTEVQKYALLLDWALPGCMAYQRHYRQSYIETLLRGIYPGVMIVSPEVLELEYLLTRPQPVVVTYVISYEASIATPFGYAWVEVDYIVQELVWI